MSLLGGDATDRIEFNFEMSRSTALKLELARISLGDTMDEFLHKAFALYVLACEAREQGLVVGSAKDPDDLEVMADFWPQGE
jgi:hypothetical protein